MKKFFSILTIVGLVVAGLLYFRSRGNFALEHPESTSGEIKTADNTQTGGAPKPSSLEPALLGFAATLPAETLAFFHLRPRQIDPLISYLTLQWEKLHRAKAWNKVDGDAMLLDHLVSEFSGASGSNPEQIKQMKAVGEEAWQVWSTLTEVSIVVLEKTFHAEPNFDIPMVKVSADFSTTAAPERLRQFVDREILQGKDQIKKQGSLIRINPELYQAELPKEAGGFKVVLSVKPLHIALSVGSDNFDQFVSVDSKSSLSEAADWKKIQGAATASAAISYFFRPEKANELFIRAVSNAPGLEKQEIEKFTASLSRVWKDIGAGVSSSSFDNGIAQSSCLSMKPDSTTAGIYRAFYETRSNGDSPFLGLINSRTVFLTKANVGGVTKWLESFASLYSCDTPDCVQMRDAIDKIKQPIETFGFREFGIAASGRQGNAIPDLVLYLGQAKLSGSQLLEQVSSTVTQLKESAGGNAQQITASITGGNDGQSVFKLAVGNATVIAKVVAGNSMVLAMNEQLIAEAAEGIAAAKPAITGLEAYLNDLSQADFFLYSTITPVVPNLRPYFPFLLSTQSPDLEPGKRMGEEDLNEVLELLSGTLLFYQRTTGFDGSIYCATAKGIMF
jgi:hypothetical protein